MGTLKSSGYGTDHGCAILLEKGKIEMKKAVIFVVLFMLVGFNVVSAIPVSSANVEREFIQDVTVKNSQGSKENENAPPVEVVYDWDSGVDGMKAGTAIGIAIPEGLAVDDGTVDLVGSDGSVYGKVVLDGDKSRGNLDLTTDIPANVAGSFQLLAEKPRLKSVITAPILTGVALTDANGKAFTEENRPTVDSAANIYFEWALLDEWQVQDGDTYTFQLPDIFKLYSNVTGTLGDYGTFVAHPDGTVVMTFNENVALDSNVKGSLQFNTKFDVSKMETSTSQTVEFPVEGSDSVTLHFVPENGKDIVKTGTPNQAFSPDGLDWKVRVNGKQQVMQNAVLKDAIPDGLTLDVDSIAVYRLDVFMDGSSKVGELADASEYTIVKTDDGSLEIRFADGRTDAYEVRYKTAIEDMSKVDFTNVATFENNGASVTDSATIPIKRGEHLTKRGTFDPKSQRVKWTIEYNFDGMSVAQQDAILHDLFDGTHQLVDGSLVVKHVSIDADGDAVTGDVVPGADYVVTPVANGTQNGFDLQFHDAISTPYVITYETEMTYDNADLTAVVNGVATPNAPLEETTVNVVAQSITKQLVDADYSSKTMKWEQHINVYNYAMDHAVIRDTFASGGLTLLPETLRLVDKDDSGKVLTEGVDYMLASDAGGFEITLIGDYASQMTHELVLTYATSFQFEAIQNGSVFKNDTTLEWGPDDGKKSSTDTVTVDPGYYTQKNGFKLGSYDAATKEITWMVGFNFNLLTMDAPVLKDVVPDAQKLLPDTVEVHKMKLGKEPYSYSDGGIVNADAYTLDTSDNTVTVTFKTGISEAYYVTFKTSLEDSKILPVYKNSATLTDGDQILTTVDGFVTVPNGGNYVSKNGVQDGDNMHWNVTINAGQSVIHQAKVVDTPSKNQIFLPETIHLYSTKMAGNGSFVKDTELVQGEDYELVVNRDSVTGNQSFEISFADTISTAYLLDYDTFIDAADMEVVSNDVQLTGSNITTEQTTTSADVVVRTSDGSGGASGGRGTLTVHKVDQATSKALAGAEFGLYSKDGAVLLRTATSDEFGVLTFASIRYGEYVVKELAAPTGYFKSESSEAGIKVTMDAANKDVTVENEAFVGEARLVKYEKGTTTRLAGATFSLMRGDVVVKTDLKTDENGELVVRDLEPGDYSFVETAAPEGYKINEEPRDFTIGEKQNVPVNVTVEDELILGTLVITKQDKVTKMPLSGAVFDLVDGDGNVVKSDVVSDFEGKIVIENLPLGDYELVETQAPTDYVRGDAAIPITISKATTEQNLYYETVDNELAKGGVILTKTDSVDAQKLLAGAVFDLRDSDGNTIQTNLVTDDLGAIVVADLIPGDYSFVETGAPSGYKLDATPMPFSIVKSQQEFVHVVVSNVMLESPEELPEPPTPNVPEEEVVVPPSGGTPPEVVTPIPQEVTGNHVVTPVGSPGLPTIKEAKPTMQKWSAQRLPTTGDTRNEPLTWIGFGLILMSGIYLSRRQK